jgi:HK97 family phage prohead protease
MNRIDEVRAFVEDTDPKLRRMFDFEVERVSENGDEAGAYTMVGHAAVFNRWSLDLGGFRERIKKGAFDNALAGDPHVLHVWDHDTARVLSSTRNNTLDLSIDPKGLRYWSKVAPTSYASDLRILLERGDISQSSFAFTVKADEWRVAEQDGEEIVERTITEVDELFDVTTCAMGAYPATDSALALRSLLSRRSEPKQVAVAFPNYTGTTTATTSLALREALLVPAAVPSPQGNETEDAPVAPVVEPRTSNEDVVREIALLKRAADAAVQKAHDRALRRGGTSS